VSISLTFTTSGTTGTPKAVTHCLEAMLANAAAFNEAAGLDGSTRMYHCLPRAHMAGVLNTILCPTLAGGRVIFGPTFSAATAGRFWGNLLGSGANTIWITPTIAAMLLRLNRDDLVVTQSYGRRLRNVFCGTAPLPLETRWDWAGTFGIPLQDSYGTSEQMLVSVQSREDASIGNHDVGRPLPGMSVEIHDDEITVNGSATGDQGQWVRGGDRFTVTGRLKDLIIRGGINISPAAIEETVRKLPSVNDVAVVGQPHKVWGEMIAVFAEGPCSRAVIDGHCRDALPKSHWPDRIEIVERLPRNEMGKVRKADLR
jgi:acyl-coenzyme A synthetase/AMP-(fatty) acid ligase